MTAVQMLPAAQRPGQPWKNAGGRTFQVASHPADSSIEDFGWRVSIAEVVADGQFSHYEGVDRIIAVIDGAGMDLDLDDKVHQLGKYTTYRFPGEAQVMAHLLRGPTRDLNLMVRRGRFSGRMEIFSSPGGGQVTVRCAERETVLVVALDGTACLQDEPQTRLGIEDAWMHPEPGVTNVAVNGTIAVIHIREV